jgi:hypothetical protein
MAASISISRFFTAGLVSDRGIGMKIEAKSRMS